MRLNKAFCYAGRQSWPVEGESMPMNENYIDSQKKKFRLIDSYGFLNFNFKLVLFSI